MARTPLAGQIEPMRPKGPQPLVDWRWVRPGFVGWYAGERRVGVWEPAPDGTRAAPDGPWGLTLRAEPARKVGPVLDRDRPWEHVQYVCSVIRDGGVYRAWYESAGLDQLHGKDPTRPTGFGTVLCYAESDDGFAWRKPNLDALPYAGEARTNVVYGAPLAPHGYWGGSVFRDPHGPAAERYKLLAMGIAHTTDPDGWRRTLGARFGDDVDPMCFRDAEPRPRRPAGMGGHYDTGARPSVVHFMAGAVSPDGLGWMPIEAPLMAQFSDTMNSADWDAARGRYVAYLRTWRFGRRCVGRAESADFRHWSATPATVLEAPLSAHPSDDVYTNGKAVYPGSDVHLMFPAVYHRLDDSREVYMAASVDGVEWRWVPGGPVVARGAFPGWDAGDVTASIGLVELPGDRIGLPIVGCAHPHKYPRGGEPFGWSGWAVWPKGRLAAVEAADEGAFTTQELEFQGSELSLNLQTREAGVVLAELRDEQGEPVPGRTFADADPIVGDHLDRRVSWRGETGIGAWAGRPVSFAVRLRKAKLHAFEFAG